MKPRLTIPEIIRRFTLMDDDFMTAVFHNNIPATELMLRIILNMPNLEVQSVKTQAKFKNIQGHSLTLDILASDNSGKQYNIEVQNDSADASEYRARYHSALLDGNFLPAGKSLTPCPKPMSTLSRGMTC